MLGNSVAQWPMVPPHHEERLDGFGLSAADVADFTWLLPRSKNRAVHDFTLHQYLQSMSSGAVS